MSEHQMTNLNPTRRPRKSQSQQTPPTSLTTSSSAMVLIELGFMMVYLVYIQLSKNRRVSVRNWNGKIWIDIREFYVKDGKTLPGKKGISLSVDQWNTLRNHAEDIEKALSDLS
ncbi:RNA polymerase II transcriptional coactivator KIWI isoform X2 [Arabidopsis lyrata subsp. lyrata]|uniref:RNA polymerase II transcriptional coactivator KIWI isoform X2 n=1 Tax=Arabidopsis lyrata subsp. lyrata TaxID=81972 RepID=UPI000A29B779|nr:RNA polymerase II transcriptional coactivator KIWI isoform X2 [Arabidopsis lyrata subsp. lyrata]|eukprot:XP_020877312.1 RNA polymerase II transcriptional coactivator KIWI isoform X2 [Arabidopsis lyrata subsp. lyrata]